MLLPCRAPFAPGRRDFSESIGRPVTKAARLIGMSIHNTNTTHRLPHHKLVAYQVAFQLLRAVIAADIRDRTLRDQALRAAKSACCNCAEGASRVLAGEKRRAFSIARGEVGEAVAVVEIAAA